MKCFAYGANLKHKKRIPTATKICNGVLLNHELRFNGTLTIDHKPNAIVHGIVLDISINDEEILDIYEGYGTSYYKEQLLVLDGANVHSCMTYVMIDEWEFEKYKIPNVTYHRKVLEGYYLNKLNPKLLETAFNNACYETKRTKELDQKFEPDLYMESSSQYVCGSEEKQFDKRFRDQLAKEERMARWPFPPKK